MQRKVYIANEKMKCKTPSESSLIYLPKLNIATFFIVIQTKMVDETTKSNVIKKIMKNYDMSSSVIEENELNLYQLDLLDIQHQNIVQ